MIVVGAEPATTRWERRGECSGCGHCLDPATPVLLTTGNWRPIGEIQPGDSVVGFDEHTSPGRRRQLRQAVVVARGERRAAALRIITSEGVVIASPDHPWLVRIKRSRGRKWRLAQDLRPGMLLISLADPVVPLPIGSLYRQGYLGGVSAGDAMIGHWRAKTGFAHHGYRLAMLSATNMPILDRVQQYAAAEGIVLRSRIHSETPGGVMMALETWKAEEVTRLERWATDRGRPAEYERGFLAGLFDAEGSCSKTLRITNTNRGLLDRAAECLSGLKFSSVFGGPRTRSEARRPVWEIRLLGGHREILRFFAMVQPRADWKVPLDRQADGRSAEILAIEPAGERRLVDLKTTACTFVAAGLLTHNCCQFLGERVMTMKFTGNSDDYDRQYLELRGIRVDPATRTGTKKIGIFLPCTAHDLAGRRCTVYERRPRTCRDFPWGPEQISGTPCSFWFSRNVNGKEEIIAGDGAPEDIRAKR